jgi:serine/threonine protein kinase
MFFLILFIGAFGEVRMCVHRDSGAQRAVKVLRKSNMDEDEKKMLFNEINILKELVSSDCPSPFLKYYYITSDLLFNKRNIFG